ncbi:MAG: aconitate hydratase [Firmicutes bacterium]|nr:aconitate hydratase [Bacillota bacterium]
MALNLTQRILSTHLLQGKLIPGEEIAIRPDQTLTQDATGTMVYLQFEAMGIDKVKTELAVSYIDHNMLQVGYENADDHRYLASAAAKYGVYLSRPGNGICHQVHLEHFASPGKILLGSDSHTPTAGALAMLGIGAGGLDVAVALAGGPYYLTMPRVVGVELKGKLKPWVAAKDIILELLRRLTVKGGVGRIFEYYGDGVTTLSVYERATIANMGAELGATSSIFPIDERTREFLLSVGREAEWRPLAADQGATYDEKITLELDALEPLIARPHSPDNVIEVRKIVGLPVQQVAIGSCTNSSFKDMAIVAAILKDKIVPPEVSLVISPGTRRVFQMMLDSGILASLVKSGARILELACGPCNGIGQSPASGSVSVRTFNRNYRGRSGTLDAQVYLASPEVAAATALNGRLTDPRELGVYPQLETPATYPLADSLIVSPPKDNGGVSIVRGPNIQPVPKGEPPADRLECPVLLKVGDNISTDDIIPGGAKLLALRSNVPAAAEYVFQRIDSTLAKRAQALAKPWVVVAGENYGQGSSREQAVMAPLYLGMKAVIAKSFARIHRQNLINFGLLPLTFAGAGDYELLDEGDLLVLEGLQQLLKEKEECLLVNKSKGFQLKLQCNLTPREREIIAAGSLLNYTRKTAIF